MSGKPSKTNSKVDAAEKKKAAAQSVKDAATAALAEKVLCEATGQSEYSYRTSR